MIFLEKHKLEKIKNINKKIMIDPGHGGSDYGATGNGIVEKDINLVMAFAAAKLLEYAGATVKMTRYDTVTEKTIKQRCDEALEWEADLLLSIHNNAGGGDGFEAIHTIFQKHSIGDEVAKSIGKAVTDYTNQNLRRIFSKSNSKGQDWYGINRLSGSIPSVITESAFLDNAEDVKIIDTIVEQQEFGYVIATGVANYFGAIKRKKIRPDTTITTALKEISNNLDIIVNDLKGV